MKTNRSKLVLLALVGAVLMADMLPGSGWVTGGLLVKDAEAVVGRPLTPVSVAGVARRTTRRVVATTTYVATLPPSCTVVVIEGVSLQQCGGTYYQQSGTQYVVVVVE
jgi:hypothetical protein